MATITIDVFTKELILVMKDTLVAIQKCQYVLRSTNTLQNGSIFCK